MVGGDSQGHEVWAGVPPRGGCGGEEGTGMGRSSLGHGILVEVRRYESIKNHFLQIPAGREEMNGGSAFPSSFMLPGDS